MSVKRRILSTVRNVVAVFVDRQRRRPLPLATEGVVLMPIHAKAVADFFLRLAVAEGKDLSPMQVQKLVYFAHGWYLAIVGKPLIAESVEAWDYGPVIRSLYREFSKYGAAPIPAPDENCDEEPMGSVQEEVIRIVWDKYKGFDALQLSALTHQLDSPWMLVKRQRPGVRDAIIPQADMMIYFKKQLNG